MSINLCTRYVPPSRWHHEKFYLVCSLSRSTSISIVEGHAKYVISVLYNSGHGVDIFTTARRYSEFNALVQTLERKLAITSSSRAVSVQDIVSVSFG
ncbi:hypothetical protein PINS_up021448 [Pythium insidiosum]|nr:hypothetical protein PINS_up021448 [Pythium insidiosum]